MEPLVTTAWLGRMLAEPPGGGAQPVVLDASSHLPAAGRDARAEFAAAHIPGALFLDFAGLLGPEQFAGRMEELGIGAGTPVILYDDSVLRTSARAWFILRHHGLADVAILDGGLGKWRAEGLPLESGSGGPARPGAAPSPGSARKDLRSKADMLANLSAGAEQVVDAREAERFSGEKPDIRPGIPAGHIPGSRNLPYAALLNADGTYRRPEELRAAFEDAGIDLARPIVTTCGSGVTASVLLFALHLIGKEDVALYDGSWAEWGADPATPKAQGPA